MKPDFQPPRLRPGQLLAMLAACAVVAFAGTAAAQDSRSGTDARGARDSGAAKAARDDGEAEAAAPSVCIGCGTVASIRETGSRTGPAWTATIGGGVVGGASGGESSAAYPGAGGYTGPRTRPSGGTAIGPTIGARDSQTGFKRSAGYDVVVRMDDGSTRTVHTETRPALSVGDRVKVAGGQVYLR